MRDVIANLIPFAAVGGILWVIARAGREPIWSEAYRRLRTNGAAMAALGIICVYVIIALLDSVGWQSSPQAERLTLLDRMFAGLPAEHTYSAPFASYTTGEPHPHKLLHTHVLGTDVLGNDVFYETLRGCRTGLIIGCLTQLIVTPVAILFGMLAGYFGKRVDDAIQYVYTVLDSIPGLLLLIVLLLVMGRDIFHICVALGVTSWVSLCRLTRGETLKHRDRDYVRAARALGVSHFRILTRHILPNLIPIVIITATLGISGNILSETILSYLGLGVPAGVGSWGNMIDGARSELAREPAIWWNLTAASTAVFIFVYAVNVFGDALRDAVDPRLRS